MLQRTRRQRVASNPGHPGNDIAVVVADAAKAAHSAFPGKNPRIAYNVVTSGVGVWISTIFSGRYPHSPRDQHTRRGVLTGMIGRRSQDRLRAGRLDFACEWRRQPAYAHHPRGRPRIPNLVPRATVRAPKLPRGTSTSPALTGRTSNGSQTSPSSGTSRRAGSL
jgi:hypothetical protein